MNISWFKLMIILNTVWILPVFIITLLPGESINVSQIERRNNSASNNSATYNSEKLSLNSTVKDGTDVLLLAYMRTGSTFLGKVLGWRDDVFYWFEPLIKDLDWQYLRGNDLLCQYLKPVCEIMRGGKDSHRKTGLRFLLDIFDCRLEMYDNMLTYINFQPEALPPSWFEYASCKKSMNTSTTCNLLLLNSCERAKHRMAKVLRIDLESAVSILEHNPKLKIVQLLRDPRAIMNSHLHTRWYAARLRTLQHIEDDAIVLCSRLRNDILSGKSQMKLHPDRVKLLQYEDFNKLDEKFEKLLKFLNMDQPDQRGSVLESFKENKLLHEQVCSENIQNCRHDGFHPYLFREQMNWNIAEIVQRHCGDVLKELGLRQFKTEAEYRNMSLNVVINKLPFELT